MALGWRRALRTHTAPRSARRQAHSAVDSPSRKGAETMADGAFASLHALLGMCASYMSAESLDLIQRAYRLAAQAHNSARRASGEPFIEHPLAVARVLASLAMDP